MIAKMQVTYANQVRWEMEGTQVHAIMMEDFRMKGNNSMLAAYDKVAERYGMPPVSTNHMDKKSIKFEIRRTSDMELWEECFVSRITP